MRILKLFLIVLVCLSGSTLADARMPEPANMPVDLKGMEPHRPQAAMYYLKELVQKGKMTPEEAERTEVYMLFRNARRMQDLKEAQGLSKGDRRVLMKHKREIRGNPLKEYADYCGFSYERARELMDAMHGSDKGDKYYNQMMGNAVK